MRKMRIALSVLFMVALVIISGCKVPENESPTIELLNPLDEAIIMQGELVIVSAKADDKDGSITGIKLFIDSEEVVEAEASSAQYEWNTSEVVVGSHIVSAAAKDNDEASVVANHLVLIDTPGGFNPDLTYGTMTDYDGNSYGTIVLGEQTWMAENLKVTNFADGTAIPLVSGESEWDALESTSVAYCWYDNMIEYKDTTGALYTWTAAMNGAESTMAIPSGVQGVCPDGWHLPSDEEWKSMEIFLGMSQTEADLTDWRGTDEGSQLKETGFQHWEGALTGASNTSGFTALPGGFRGVKGEFFSEGQYGTFWTATGESGTEKAWYRALYFDNDEAYRQYNYMSQGFSVRCVKDE